MRAQGIASLLVAMLASGCGLTVPEIQDFPATPGDGQLLVQGIVNSVHCEVSNAVRWVIDHDKENAKRDGRKRATEWLEPWGARITLQLTVEEKSTLNPNAVWMPHSPASAIFTLGGGASVTAVATRIEKLNFFWTVAELYRRAGCTPGIQQGNATSLLIQSDLKLTQWLQDQVSPVASGEVFQPVKTDTILKQDVLSHEVKFQLTTSGNITPAWKLTRATVNQSGTFFSTSRDRTHDLTVTFGPADPTSRSLMPPAEFAHLASQIGLSTATNLKGLVVTP
jgi:hypothetical protein